MTAGYPGIGEIGGPIGRPDPAPPKKVEREPTELELANKRADAAEADAKSANEALRASIASPRPPPTQRTAPPATPPDPGKMPDPATQPAEFEAWQERTRAWDKWENRQHVEQVRSTETSSASSTRVLDRFINAHPKYAPLRSQVYQCFNEAAIELGITEIPEDTTQLDALAEKKMTLLVNTAAKASDLPTGDPIDEEDPAQRTGGLSGGSTGGLGGGAPPKEDDGIRVKTLTEVQRELQAKSPLF